MVSIKSSLMSFFKKIYISKFWFFIPAIIVLGLTFGYSIFRLFMTSFQKSVSGKIVFAGLENFKKVLSDTIFYESIRNNAILIAIIVPLLIFISIIFSITIYNNCYGAKFFQVLIFLPYILSITVTGVLFSYLLQTNGVINEFLRKVGLDLLTVDWLGNRKIAIVTIALIIVWKEIGFGTILFISRLGTLSESLVDATKIDGANKWQMLLNLYIPHLKGIIVFYSTLIIVNMLSWVFNYVFVMTAGANNTMVFEMYVYRQLFFYTNRWGGSAASILVSLVVVVIIFLQMRSRIGLSEEE